MKRVTLLCAGLLLAASMVFATGTKEGAGAAPAPAPKNTVLRLITWSGYAPQELIDKFTAETGVKVEVTLSNNEEMISKLRATRGGGFDLAQPSQDRISAVVAEFGIYQAIDYSRIDAAQIDPSLLAAVKKNTLVNGQSYAVPHVYGTEGLIVNTSKAPDIKDFKDLLDPKYAGRVSYRMKRPTLIGMGYSLGYKPFDLYAAPDKYQAFLNDMEKALVAAKPYVKTYWDNGDQLQQLLLSGEVWAASGWEQTGWKLHETNPDIDYLAPSSGALAWVDTFAIPARSENVVAAYQWINFMMRAENAAFVTNKEIYGTASKDAVKFLKPEIAANFTRSLPPEVLAKINWYPTVPAGLEEMEGKTLDKIKAAR